MGENAITVSNLTKQFGTVKEPGYCIEDINISLEEHQFATIIGPSGCGKSVLLNIIAGIDKPTSGSVAYFGDVYEHGIPPESRKRVGFVFQNSNLLPWRTVEQNLSFPLEILKMKNPENKARIHSLLKMVGLQDYEEAFPHELSGGMQQRVGVARAFVHDPEILLLDQPFGAVDAITRKMLNYDLLNIWRTTHKSILMVTNDIDEALLLSSKVFYMSKNPGRIIKQITVDIPDEARDINIIGHPRFIELKNELQIIINNQGE